jgi:hypothetical protein
MSGIGKSQGHLEKTRDERRKYLKCIKGRESFGKYLNAKDIYVCRTCYLYDIVEEQREKENTTAVAIDNFFKFQAPPRHSVESDFFGPKIHVHM